MILFILGTGSALLLWNLWVLCAGDNPITSADRAASSFLACLTALAFYFASMPGVSLGIMLPGFCALIWLACDHTFGQLFNCTHIRSSSNESGGSGISSDTTSKSGSILSTVSLLPSDDARQPSARVTMLSTSVRKFASLSFNNCTSSLLPPASSRAKPDLVSIRSLLLCCNLMADSPYDSQTSPEMTGSFIYSHCSQGIQ